ncbi:hypothetical protein [Photobacterium indicum]|uniref:Uncharacterized protein n=1 Tax=Photobacterium indicum TaxID=81447 RepID=A0A2T3LAD4_9GAMM|nr:hypothetical protein [Photobacterium indicum]PSV48264.1 hypothetical protein C9J47_06975 [Photobacterium indicum]
MVDENLTYITSDGFFKAYNFMGDAVDGGVSCFVEASGNQVNASYMNQRLKYDDNTRQYYVRPKNDSSDSFVLKWEYDSYGTLVQVYHGTSNTNLSIQSVASDLSFKTVIRNLKVADDDRAIQINLCN